ncbi:MAG TPA: hypothetical protein VE572_00165, partial [Nitrososphaeraceae archaeon]|nr:hypothetical protein [Nitrososphaeraceae archaeon]
KLIASVVFGKVIVPFPESVNRIWVWFIGVWLKLICRSRRTGSGDSSNSDEDSGVVIVCAVVIVVAAAGAVIILDVAIIIATVKMVAAAAMRPLLFFLICFISLPNMNTIDKRIPSVPSIERYKEKS